MKPYYSHGGITIYHIVRFLYAAGLVAGVWSVWVEGTARSASHQAMHLVALAVCVWGLRNR